MDATHEQAMELMRVGGILYDRLRDVRDEFGPDGEGVGNELGWAEVDSALDEWRRALKLREFGA